MKKIKTTEELCRVLCIKNINELPENEDAQQRLLEIKNNLMPEVVEKLLLVPDVAQFFQEIVAKMCGLGSSLEESERVRWESLRELAKDGEMTPEQRLEGMRILRDIKAKESIDWTSIFKTTVKVAGFCVIVAVVVVGAVGIAKAQDT